MREETLRPLQFTVWILGLMGLVWILQVVVGFLLPALDPTGLGVRPREVGSILPGMLFMPLLHGNAGHLFSNGLALAFLLPLFFVSHRNTRRAVERLAILWLGTGLLLWLVGPSRTLHIGASGLVYALSGYLVVYGLRGAHWMALVAALLVIVFQTASLLAGLLPMSPGISYSGHWCGLIVGALVGFKSEPERQSTR